MNRLMRARIIQLKNAVANEVVAETSSLKTEEAPVSVLVDVKNDAGAVDDVESLIVKGVEPELLETTSLDVEESKEVEVIDSTHKKKVNTFKGKMT